MLQVLRPEEAGTGFSEVGALSEAKDALREVVQLPLQYPELFATASLAKLSKGVLLFGPPGRLNFQLQRFLRCKVCCLQRPMTAKYSRNEEM